MWRIEDGTDWKQRDYIEVFEIILARDKCPYYISNGETREEVVDREGIEKKRSVRPGG